MSLKTDELERMRAEHVDDGGFCAVCMYWFARYREATNTPFPCDAARLLARVRELEGALTFYADPENWEWVDQSNVAGWMCHVADDEDTHPWIPASAALAGGE